MIRFTLALLWVLISLSAWSQPRPMVGKLICHTAAEGEDLGQIALRYRLTIDHLAAANGFPFTTLQVAPGSRVWIPSRRILPANPPKNGVVVNLPERMLYLFRNGRFDAFYPLSIGDESASGGRFQTPTGTYRILEKVPSPTWYPPAWAENRTPVGPGPNNPLGAYWVGLTLPRTGIHGTNDPLNVGNSVTHGCMRMYPSLLLEFYRKVQVGWEARIEYETAKLGRDGSGRVFLATFPDVYRKRPSLASAQGLLRQARVKPLRDNFQDIEQLELGVPVDVRGRGALVSEWAQQAGVNP